MRKKVKAMLMFFEKIALWVYWHTIKVRKRLKELEKRGGAT